MLITYLSKVVPKSCITVLIPSNTTVIHNTIFIILFPILPILIVTTLLAIRKNLKTVSLIRDTVQCKQSNSKKNLHRDRIISILYKELTST